jgi:hypothetical protein
VIRLSMGDDACGHEHPRSNLSASVVASGSSLFATSGGNGCVSGDWITDLVTALVR